MHIAAREAVRERRQRSEFSLNNRHPRRDRRNDAHSKIDILGASTGRISALQGCDLPCMKYHFWLYVPWVGLRI